MADRALLAGYPRIQGIKSMENVCKWDTNWFNDSLLQYKLRAVSSLFIDIYYILIQILGIVEPLFSNIYIKE